MYGTIGRGNAFMEISINVLDYKKLAELLEKWLCDTDDKGIVETLKKLPGKLVFEAVKRNGKLTRNTINLFDKVITLFINHKVKKIIKNLEFTKIETSAMKDNPNGIKITVGVRIVSYDGILFFLKCKCKGNLKGYDACVLPIFDTVQEVLYDKKIMDRLLITYVERANKELCDFAGDYIFKKKKVDLKFSDFRIVEK